MKRFVKLILVLAIVCVLYPTGVAAGSKTAEKKLSKTEAKAVAEQIKAQWLADTKVRLASVYNNKVAKSDTLTMPLWWRVYGQKPADGYQLFISLAGGGGGGAKQLVAPRPVGSVQCDGVGVRAGLEFGQPQGGALGVGQILFVEDFQFGFVRREFAQQGVFAGCGHARVQHFYHHIDAFKPFDNRFFGLVHVAGIPLDCHVFRFSVLNMGKAV